MKLMLKIITTCLIIISAIELIKFVIDTLYNKYGKQYIISKDL